MLTPSVSGGGEAQPDSLSPTTANPTSTTDPALASTHTAYTPDTQVCPILDIPTEIRLMIYERIPLATKTFIDPQTHVHEHHHCERRVTATVELKVKVVDKAILGVCRAFRSEATAIIENQEAKVHEEMPLLVLPSSMPGCYNPFCTWENQIIAGLYLGRRDPSFYTHTLVNVHQMIVSKSRQLITPSRLSMEAKVLARFCRTAAKRSPGPDSTTPAFEIQVPFEAFNSQSPTFISSGVRKILRREHMRGWLGAIVRFAAAGTCRIALKLTGGDEWETGNPTDMEVSEFGRAVREICPDAELGSDGRVVVWRA